MSSQLPSTDSHHIQAAIGWIELGNHVEANEELERAFDRRTGELNDSLSGSARFISLLTIMENTRFSLRIGQIDRMFTPLEKAVLDAMLDKPGEPFETVRKQLAHATIAKREFSGVGFFTNFIVLPDAPVRRDLLSIEIGHVGAEFPGLQHGAGFLLFIRDGVVSWLEGFTYDEPWPTSTDEFRVHKQEAA